MRKPRQLKPQDVMFVGGENAHVYQHTMGLILLDSSGRPGFGFGFDALRRHIETRLSSVPQFRWKLHEVPLGLDLPYWVADENFSFDHHIRRIAVPSPGDHRALGETVAYLYSRHIDRSRPLWEIWFIEGLADGRFAVAQKMHHCMMDGTGAMKLMDHMWDLEPDAAPRPVDRATAEALPGDVPEQWQLSLNAARHLYGMPMQIGRGLYDVAWRSLAKRFSATDDASKKRPTAPTAIFNADITGDRGFVFGSVPLRDIKTVKRHFDVTVNDVVLAVVGGSLRDYLLARAALPDEALRSSIAVSLRTDADDEFSNRVTTASVTLATDLADPVQRLRAIAAEAVAAKEEAHHGGKGVLEFVQALPPVLVGTIMRMAPADQVSRLMGVNVIVSNMRGSAAPMYVGGARVSAIYPMSILAPGGGLNITCLSYADEIHFGVAIEPNLVPDPWRIIDGLHTALAEYVALTGTGARRGKVGTGKPGMRKRKRATVRKTAAATP